MTTTLQRAFSALAAVTTLMLTGAIAAAAPASIAAAPSIPAMTAIRTGVTGFDRRRLGRSRLANRRILHRHDRESGGNT
jgi:hypothetical protein